MSVFKRTLEVDVHDVDFNGVAKASSIMRYMQATAQLQLTANGMTYEALYDRKRAFILSKIRIEIDEAVRAYERLNATTFPCESRGYSFLRCYGIERDGVRVARAASVWALVDVETRGLVKVDDFDLGLTTHEPLDLTPSRFRLPSELLEVGYYKVGYGVTDQNKHMNNTAYPDMYSSFLPLDGARIRSITVNYLNEAPIGENLKVLCAKADGKYYFRTTREDGKINSEAEIEITAI